MLPSPLPAPWPPPRLWRRRAAEGWRRLRGEDPAPEPLEGWARFAVTEREAFEARLRDARDLAGLDAQLQAAPAQGVAKVAGYAVQADKRATISTSRWFDPSTSGRSSSGAQRQRQPVTGSPLRRRRQVARPRCACPFGSVA